MKPPINKSLKLSDGQKLLKDRFKRDPNFRIAARSQDVKDAYSAKPTDKVQMRASRATKLAQRQMDAYTSTSPWKRMKANVALDMESRAYGIFGQVGEAYRQAKRASTKAEAKSIKKDYFKRYVANVVERNLGGSIGGAYAQRIRNTIGHIQDDDPAKAFQKVRENFVSVVDQITSIEKRIIGYDSKINSLNKKIGEASTNNIPDNTDDVKTIRTEVSGLTTRMDNNEVDIRNLKTYTQTMNSRLVRVDDKVDRLNADIDSLKESVTVSLSNKNYDKNSNSTDNSNMMGGLFGGFGRKKLPVPKGAGALSKLKTFGMGVVSTVGRHPGITAGVIAGMGAYYTYNKMKEGRKKAESGEQVGLSTEDKENILEGSGGRSWGGKASDNIRKNSPIASVPLMKRMISDNDTDMDARINRAAIEKDKSQFMQFGALPSGFEFIPGHRGRLGTADAVAATGAQPLPLDYQFSRGSIGSSSGSTTPYSSGGREGGYGFSNTSKLGGPPIAGTPTKIWQNEAALKPNKELGSVSAKYESGGRGVGFVSSGKGDPGGVSYGVHQLSTKDSMPAFLRSTEGKVYASRFAGMQVGSPEFNATYKKIANEDPSAFQNAQKDFYSRTHYQPLLSHAKSKGLDITDRGVQEALFSMSVQHGGAKKIVNSIGNVSNDPNEQVKALYAARTNYVSNLTSLPNATKSSVLNRYQREQNDSLALAGIKDTKESTNELASLGLLTKEALSQKVLPKVDDRPSLDNRVIERQQQVAGIRKLSLKSDLKDKLGFAAEKSNLYWESTSGGQKFGGPRTGSHRHNIDIPGTPGASDGKLYELDANGKRRYLSIYNKDDLPKINKFVENFTAVTPGSGVGANYMGVGAERGQLLHMGGPNKPGGPAANYKGQSHVGEGFQRGLDRFGKPETQAEFEAYIKARDNPDKKPSDRVIETVPELSKETIPLKDRGFAAMSMAARNQTIALKNDAETTAAPAAIPVPTQTIDLAAKPAATPVEQAKPDTRQADAQMLEANNVEPVLPPPVTEKVSEPVADDTKAVQSSTPKPVNDAPGNATQGGAYGGGTRHNPETRAATPGSGGRGSAGRCYL